MGQVGAIDGSGGWATNLWGMMGDGGTWTVPRCGLAYRKDETAMQFVLYARMPHCAGMPVTEEELRSIQDEDHQGITDMFRAIGVEVVEEGA